MTEIGNTFSRLMRCQGKTGILRLWAVGGTAHTFGGTRVAYRTPTKAGWKLDTLNEKAEPRIPHAQNYFGFLGPQVAGTADRAWFIRKSALEDIFIQPANVERLYLKLSPVGLYDAATQAWAGTDLLGIRDFFDAARRYRQHVIDYFYDAEIFRSRQWFSSDKGAADWRNLPTVLFSKGQCMNTTAKRVFIGYVSFVYD